MIDSTPSQPSGRAWLCALGLAAVATACGRERANAERVAAPDAVGGEARVAAAGAPAKAPPPSSELPPTCALSATPPSGALQLLDRGQMRGYTLILPDGYDGVMRVPVLFAWHGTGSSGAEFLGQYYGDLARASAGRMLLVAPDGLVETEGEWAGQTRWQLTDLDGGLFDSLLALLRANYCIDTRRVFSTGHSIGAYFTNYLGCTRGDVLRGIAPISGGGPFDAHCQGQPAVLVGHNPGECSEVGMGCPFAVPWATTGWPTLQFWSARNRCDALSTMPTAAFDGMPPCRDLTGCQTDAPVRLCLFDYASDFAGPHAWPTPWLGSEIIAYFVGLPSKAAN